MANAIVGSLELLALAGVIGIPVGVLGGVYLAEYGSARINSVLRFLPTSSTASRRLPGAWSFTDWSYCGSKASPPCWRSRAGSDHDSTHSAHDRRSRSAGAQWISRSCARARCQPVENNRAHRNEDRIQGDHHWHFAGVSTGRRRDRPASFHCFWKPVLESQPYSSPSPRFRCKFSLTQFLPMTTGIARPGPARSCWSREFFALM